MRKQTRRYLLLLAFCIHCALLSVNSSWSLVTDITVDSITVDELVDPGDLTAVSAKVTITDDGNRDEWFFLRVSNQGIGDNAIAKIEIYHDKDKDGAVNLPNDEFVGDGTFTDTESLLNLQGPDGGFVVGQSGQTTTTDFLFVITLQEGETQRGDQVVLFLKETAFFFRRAGAVGPSSAQGTIQGPTVKGVESIAITALNEGKPASFGEEVELATIEIRTDVNQKLELLTLQLTSPSARTSIDSLLLYKDSDPLQRRTDTDGAPIAIQNGLNQAIITFRLDEDLLFPVGTQSVANSFLLTVKVKVGGEAREGDLLGVTMRKDTSFIFSNSGAEGPDDDFIAQGPQVSALPPEPSIEIFFPAQTPPPFFDDQFTIEYQATGPNPAATITFFYATRADFGNGDVQALRDRIVTQDDTGIAVPANTGITPLTVLTVGNSTGNFVGALIDVPENTYTIYGIVEDADESSKLARSEGQIEVRHDVDVKELSPQSDTAVTDGSFLIRWMDKKNNGNAQISLYYSTNDLQADVDAIQDNAVFIAAALNEDDDGTLGQHKWNFRDASVSEGTYFLYAIIRDTNLQSPKQKATKSDGQLTISYPPTINLISPILQGSRAVDEFTISWFWQDLNDNVVGTTLFYHREAPADADSQDSIKILLDTIGPENSAESGKITTIDKADVGRFSFSWDIGMELTGSYYIYAKIEDVANHSAYAIAPGLLTIRRVNLRLRPSTIVVGPGEEFTVAVQLRNPGIEIEGASVYLTFDDQFLQIQNLNQPFSQPSSSLGDDPQSMVFDLDAALANEQEILENDSHGDTIEDNIANGISGFQLDYSIVVKENPASVSDDYRTLARLTFEVSTDIDSRPINTTVSVDFDESENRSTSVVTATAGGSTEKDITPIAAVPALMVQIAPFASISGMVLLESRQDHSQQITFALREPGKIADVTILDGGTGDEDSNLSGIQMTAKPDGSYTLEGIPTGVWELVAKAPGFLRGQYQSKPSDGSVLLSIVPGDKLQDVDIFAQDGSDHLIAGDITDDNRINIEDFAALISAFGTREGDSLFNTNADINDDGRIDIFDFQIVNRNFGLLGIPPTGSPTLPPPAAPSNDYDTVRLSVPVIPEVVQANSNLEINLGTDATNLKGYAYELEYDPRFMRLVDERAQEGDLLKRHPDKPMTLFISKSYDTESGTKRVLVANMIVGPEHSVSGTGTLTTFRFVSVADGHTRFQLRNLVIMDGDSHLIALPDEWSRSVDILEVPTHTELVQNYPNPFNPETWIPYRLSETSQVRVQIYNSTGRLIRFLNLGVQNAGDYTHRSYAAYWDGRNDFGERVSSGIYFYELLTDYYSSVRKMVILK